MSVTGPAIYGTIISAAVMASAEETESVIEIAVVVFVTVLVYWLAERYSELLGRHMSGRPNRAEVRAVFAHGWPMVQASYTPLAVLLGVGLLGADTITAVNVALAYTIGLLFVLGLRAGRGSGLTGWSLVLATLFTGLLGVVLVGLKLAFH